MPTNTEINTSIVAGTVPPDRNCPRSGQDVVQLVQDFCSINSGASNGGAANTALEAVQGLQAAQKEVRASALIPIPTGDSNFSFSFTPPMPSTDYDVYVTYYTGAAGFISAFYNFRVLESSLTVNGFNLIFDNTPANTKASIRVIQR
jgi:hypothetical protein